MKLGVRLIVAAVRLWLAPRRWTGSSCDVCRTSPRDSRLSRNSSTSGLAGGVWIIPVRMWGVGLDKMTGPPLGTKMAAKESRRSGPPILSQGRKKL